MHNHHEVDFVYPPLTTNVCNEAKLLLAAFKQKEKLASRKIRVSLGPRFSEPNVFVFRQVEMPK